MFGCLDENGHVDKKQCQTLIAACQGKPATFHRAFDLAFDPMAACEDIIALGFSRILTSGQKKSAYKGNINSIKTF